MTFEMEKIISQTDLTAAKKRIAEIWAEDLTMADYPRSYDKWAEHYDEVWSHAYKCLRNVS